jgi:dihydrofolate reductase
LTAEPQHSSPETSVRIALIVAVARNGVIGRDGDLPWRLSSDLKLFRRLTMGKPIIMGRRTWSTLQKRPLDGRDNIVVTRDRSFVAPGASIASSFGEALELGRRFAVARGGDEIMVIGGAEIYRASLPFAHRLYLTQVEAAPEGDTFFPPLDDAAWVETASEAIARGANDQFEARLRILDRRGAPAAPATG